MNFILVTLYIYFFFPYKKLFLNLCVYSLIKLEFYFYLVLIFMLYLWCILILSKFLKKRLLNIKINIYLESALDVIKSYILLSIFTIYYLVYLRLLTILAKKEISLNVFFFKKTLIEYASLYTYSRLVVILILVIIMLGYLLLFLQFFILIFFFKKHYLKLHFYKFYRSKYVRTFFFLIHKLENYIQRSLKDNYIYYFYVRQYFFKVLIVIYTLMSVFVNNGEIGNVLKLIPYYSLYCFFIGVYNFIINNFQYDFDVLVMESYYKELDFLMEKNELKKREYINKLLFNNSKFLFKDSIYYEFLNKVEYNYLLVQTYKYSINKEPNDFFSRIKKLKPKLLGNRDLNIKQ